MVSKQLSTLEAAHPIKDISVKAIYSTLLKMDPNKAPGTDGISIAYLEAIWNVIFMDVYIMFLNFTWNGSMPAGVNSFFMVLIPKIDSPKTISDFRPLNLINCALKILLKVLTNRLSAFLGSIISVQSGFIKSGHIS